MLDAQLCTLRETDRASLSRSETRYTCQEARVSVCAASARSTGRHGRVQVTHRSLAPRPAHRLI